MTGDVDPFEKWGAPCPVLDDAQLDLRIEVLLGARSYAAWLDRPVPRWLEDAIAAAGAVRGARQAAKRRQRDAWAWMHAIGVGTCEPDTDVGVLPTWTGEPG